MSTAHAHPLSLLEATPPSSPPSGTSTPRSSSSTSARIPTTTTTTTTTDATTTTPPIQQRTTHQSSEDAESSSSSSRPVPLEIETSSTSLSSLSTRVSGPVPVQARRRPRPPSEHQSDIVEQQQHVQVDPSSSSSSGSAAASVERARKRPRLHSHSDRDHLLLPSTTATTTSNSFSTSAVYQPAASLEYSFPSSSSAPAQLIGDNSIHPQYYHQTLSSRSSQHLPLLASTSSSGATMMHGLPIALADGEQADPGGGTIDPTIVTTSNSSNVNPSTGSTTPTYPHAGPPSRSAISNGKKPTSPPPPPLVQNGFSSVSKDVSTTNGHVVASSSERCVTPGASSFAPPPIQRVVLPGTTVYPDSWVNREELLRLMVQTLRDVGYTESAATLEAESGYSLETPEVADFRKAVLNGDWPTVVDSLSAMGIPAQNIPAAKYLVSQQHYLELLEQRATSRALIVLRMELAPKSDNQDRLHMLSSLMMCSDLNDMRARAKWDGAAGTSRRKLLADLQQYIPTGSMLPQRRLHTLLDHARAYQRSQCLYHDPRAPFSLYEDHECSRARFPTLTTYVLMEHEDEVWNIAWSHDGRFLASSSKDRSAVIWKIGPETEQGRDCSVLHILKDHKYGVAVVAWSSDDSVLVTGSEQHLKMWNVQTGVCIAEMKGHQQGVSACVPLPNGSGYVSGGMDKRIIFWDRDGRQTDEWKSQSMRVLDLAVTPDGRKLIAVTVVDRDFGASGAVGDLPPSSSHTPHGFVSANAAEASSSRLRASAAHGHGNGVNDDFGLPMRRRVVIYDLATKEELFMMPMPKEITSISVSADSKYALINHAPDDLILWDLDTHRTIRKYTGQRQREDVIRSCFGGQDGDFVLSGSEDSNVYIWRKDTGTLMEVLSGHEGGSVNAVAWNPMEMGMFASCSDDRTIRIWEAPPPGLDDIPMPNLEYDGRRSVTSDGSGPKSPPPGPASRRDGSWDGGGRLSPRIIR